jgi:fructose-1,6-bisphosphatase I
VRSAGILDLHGLDGSTNVQGEEVKKLDVVANQAFITSLLRSRKVCIMASEENEKPIIGTPNGRYVAVFDPLDGSSNIDVNISIGTIFGIYRRLDKDGEPTEKDILQPGRNLVAAGYTMYGTSTNIVFTAGSGVHGFTLDPASGEFVLTHPNMTVKNSYPIYSVNEGNSLYWHENVKQYVQDIKFPSAGKKPHSLRYVGSMVADVHRTLLYGGLFMYPGDKNSKNGKLRLLYEANPMAMIIEQAGGKASTGTQPILDVQPTSVHQRTPVFLGSKENVEAIEEYFKKYPQQ